MADCQILLESKPCVTWRRSDEIWAMIRSLQPFFSMQKDLKPSNGACHILVLQPFLLSYITARSPAEVLLGITTLRFILRFPSLFLGPLSMHTFNSAILADDPAPLHGPHRKLATCSPYDSSCNKNDGSATVIPVVLVIVMIKIGVIVWCCWCCMKRRSPQLQPEERVPEIALGEWKPGFPVNISYRQLELATNNFRDKLGAGGFGAVYKGFFSGGKEVAVKRLEGLSQGEKEFSAEVVTIGTLHHFNLVHLYGYCAEGTNHRLLVYEYLPNGSLDRFLFTKSPNAQILDWETRMKIAIGTAQGIAYFHEQCRAKIIHCDLKPENILLDANFCPKVSDFGLAKLMSREQACTHTHIRGTRGYLAPEWIADLPITVKADAFSFGKLLLEIVGGRRNLDTTVPSERLYYPSWAYGKLKNGSLVEVVDQRIAGNFDVSQLKNVLLVAFWCIQDEPDLRPSMATVVQILEGRMEVTMPPIPKGVAMMSNDDESSREGEIKKVMCSSSSSLNLIAFGSSP